MNSRPIRHSPSSQPARVVSLRRIHHRAEPTPSRPTIPAEAPGYSDWIARWFRQSVQAGALPSTARQLIAQLSDSELAIYLVAKYRSGEIRKPTRNGLF